MEKELFRQFYEEKLQSVEAFLKNSIPKLPKNVAVLEEAMRYSLMAGGKRLRPILLLTTVESVKNHSDFALPVASAIEYIHTYSLIHDDLPCMDNDDLRRGKPTSHIQFGEANALLAGDALLTHSFALIASVDREHVAAEKICRIVSLLAEKAGVFGMVTGQVADINDSTDFPPEETLTFIHSHKTGALITACIQIGAILVDLDDENFRDLTAFGEQIGKCFQIQDDILDETGDKQNLGKTPGSDQRNQKLTYPRIYGLDESRRLANQCYEKALDHLESVSGQMDYLRALAAFILKRDR